MPIELNHTIVAATDAPAAARYMTEVMGLPEAVAFGPFLVVEADNGVSLDFLTCEDPFEIQHYAFLVSEAEFDAIFGRLLDREQPYWADPHRHVPGEINTHDGGRGVYFLNPDGHVLEIITRPYGSGA